MSIDDVLLREPDRLREILAPFGLGFETVTRFVDSSHDDEDVRLNFILDDRYVLKLHSQQSVWEGRLQEIRRLIDRYRSIGVYCPQLIQTENSALCVPFEMEGRHFNCFVEEFAKHPFCTEDSIPDRAEIVEHLGVLASRFTDVDLSDVYSMWSILDLSPLDRSFGKDEKQENAELLIDTLCTDGVFQLAQIVLNVNRSLREKIAARFRELPRCVFQGDLNCSNVLVENGHFAGLIDFNLSGTDVNINVFVNETNWFPEEEEFDRMTLHELLEAMESRQADLLNVIFRHYSCNALERDLLPVYRTICDLFQYPNVCAMRKWLREENRKAKAAALLLALCGRTLE